LPEQDNEEDELLEEDRSSTHMYCFCDEDELLEEDKSSTHMYCFCDEDELLEEDFGRTHTYISLDELLEEAFGSHDHGLTEMPSPALVSLEHMARPFGLAKLTNEPASIHAIPLFSGTHDCLSSRYVRMNATTEKSLGLKMKLPLTTGGRMPSGLGYSCP
jgi:hypothetical protein